MSRYSLREKGYLLRNFLDSKNVSSILFLLLFLPLFIFFWNGLNVIIGSSFLFAYMITTIIIKISIFTGLLILFIQFILNVIGVGGCF